MAKPDLILSPILDLIIINLANAATREVQRVWGVDEELKNLESMLSAIRAVLEDAEDKQVKTQAVSDWLQKLKDVAFDAEDLVDEFTIEAEQQSEMESGTEVGKQQQVRNILSSCFSCNKVPFRREMARRIEDLNKRLDQIAKEKNSLGLITIRDDRRMVKIREHPKTSSLIHESEVFGRRDDKEEIIKSLLSGGGGNGDVSVTSIVGMGGLGKTTLAQFVYNDKRVTMHFELRAWVCVSKDFDVKRLTKEIIESASGSSSKCDFSNVEPMQRHLQEILSGKRFLLVLDDVWNENSNLWEQLRAPLKFQVEGSKILVTTRNDTVSNVMQSTIVHRLKGLTEKDCLSLFTSRAFADGSKIDDYPGLLEIAQKIVVKCDGLPLAVKTLGGLLYAKREKSEWLGILNCEIWNFPEEADEILPALRLSYHYLPAHLKQCFAFCSIYPKDHKFRKDELVSMWISNGFIHPEEGTRVEDTGSKYFNDLSSRSFFQHYSEVWGGCYAMHDLMHDLAQSISGNECFRMEWGDKRCSVPRKSRHLLVSRGSESEPSNIKVFDEFKSLRTLLVGYKAIHEIEEILHKMFENLRFLRVLDLSEANIRELPNSISTLKHLRYLNLERNYDMKRLPESVSSIYCLQTLNLDNCGELVKLPKEMRKLKNMRNLHLNNCFKLKSMPPGIGRLKHLQKLSKFVVGREAGQSIAELKEMIEIHDSIEISNLENVSDAVEVRQADLMNKEFLDELALRWNDDRTDPNLQDEKAREEVLEALQPHRNLKRLRIYCYMGNRFPSWIVQNDVLLPNLVDVALYTFRRCSILPPLGQLPSLKSFRIFRAEQVKKIGHELRGTADVGFPSLEELSLQNMSNLEEWCGVEEGDFPCLRMLFIDSCPKLRELPNFPRPSEKMTLCNLDNLGGWCSVGEAHFPNLCNLQIKGCPKMTGWPLLPALTELEIDDCHGFLSLPPIPSLCKLTLKDCNEGLLKTVPMFLTSLSSLTIESINQITSLPQGMLQALVELKELQIFNCASLVSLLEKDGNKDGGLPSTITSLQFSFCNNLKSLPSGLHLLLSLETLKIVECHQLSSLPGGGLPTALQRLWIRGCPMLKERCLKERGEDWSKIKHVPHIEID